MSLLDRIYVFCQCVVSCIALLTTRYIHSLAKKLLHVWYGQGELYRLCFNYPRGYTQTVAIERSLLSSRFLILHEELFSMEINKYITIIQQIKKIDELLFIEIIKNGILDIRGYQDLGNEMERIRKMSFDVNNAEHIALLQQIWEVLIPEETFALKSKFWPQIGFQGLCPITDFRGMGMLGATNLQYFVASYPDLARSILSSSWHPDHGFSLAITGINLTATVVRLMRDGCFKPHYYNSSIKNMNISDLHFIYVCVFASFNEFWISQKRDIMQFNIYMQDFENCLRKRIQHNNFVFYKP